MPKDTVRFGTLGDTIYFDLNACNIQKATDNFSSVTLSLILNTHL